MTDLPPSHVIDAAIAASLASPCQSKRGVTIFHGDDIVSVGYNRQPIGETCDGSDTCKLTCGTRAIHAEQMAILRAGARARDCELLHVKTVRGILAISGGPSCVQCGKFELEVGIKAVWLFHDAGWRRYAMHDYFREAVANDRILAAFTALKTDVDRLKSGRFTKDEIHNICHNLHGTVTAREFADGCAAEQRTLYGCAPDADALKVLIGVPPDVQAVLANLDHEENWDFVEFDEVAQCIRNLLMQLNQAMQPHKTP